MSRTPKPSSLEPSCKLLLTVLPTLLEVDYHNDFGAGNNKETWGRSLQLSRNASRRPDLTQSRARQLSRTVLAGYHSLTICLSAARMLLQALAPPSSSLVPDSVTLRLRLQKMLSSTSTTPSGSNANDSAHTDVHGLHCLHSAVQSLKMFASCMDRLHTIPEVSEERSHDSKSPDCPARSGLRR